MEGWREGEGWREREGVRYVLDRVVAVRGSEREGESLRHQHGGDMVALKALKVLLKHEGVQDVMRPGAVNM